MILINIFTSADVKSTEASHVGVDENHHHGNEHHESLPVVVKVSLGVDVQTFVPVDQAGNLKIIKTIEIIIAAAQL